MICHLDLEILIMQGILSYKATCQTVVFLLKYNLEHMHGEYH